MAILGAVAAGGNLNSASTWKQCTTGANSNQLTAKDATTPSNAGITYSSAFSMVSGETIDGVYLLINKQGGGNGTFTITISTDNGTTATYNSTYNVADLPSQTTLIYFKFGSTIATATSATWKLGIRTQNANVLNVRRDTTTANYFRAFRTTTTPAGAPAAGDQFYVSQELNTSGVYSASPTVVWNDTASTQFGSFVGNALVVGKGGTVACAYAASTNYTMFIKGGIIVGSGGAITLGTVINPIPSSSSCDFQIIQNATNNQYGLAVWNGGTFTAQGVDQGRATRTYLAADAAAAATSITTAVSTGWVTGDIIVLAPTRRTAAQYETRTLASNATGTSVPVTALSFGHLGTGALAGEVMMLTRNVKIRGQSSSRCSSFFFDAASIVDLDWAQVYNFGGSSGTDSYTQYGFHSDTDSTGYFSASNCSFYEMYGGYIRFGTASNLWVFTYNNIYAQNSSVGSSQIAASASAVFTDNWGIGYRGLTVQGLMDCSRNRFSGANDIGISYSASLDCTTLTFDDNVAHSCGGAAFSFSHQATAQNFTARRYKGYCSNYGINYTGTNAVLETGTDGITFDSFELFANATNFYFDKNGTISKLRVKNMVVNGGSLDSSARGFLIAGNCGMTDVIFSSCTFGATVAHTSGDICLQSTPNAQAIQIQMHNCLLNSTTEIENPSGGLSLTSWISSMKHDQVAGSHKSWYRYGRIESDQTIFRSSSPSEKLIPYSSTVKHANQGKKISVKSGNNTNISVWVRESVTGDGVDYNGSRVRLILKANPYVGINNDSVLATATVSSEGAWQQLSATVPALAADCVIDVRIDCDGTAGYVNVDDWQLAA